MDSTLAVFAAVIGLLAGVLIVVIPDLRSSQLHLESSLRNAGRTAFGNRWGRRSHDVLVIAEVAVAVVLVVASGLLVLRIGEIYERGPGFDAEDVTYFAIRQTKRKVQQELREATNSREEYWEALQAWSSPRDQEIRSRIGSLPGVESIAIGELPLLNYYRLYPATAIDGQSSAQPVEVQRLTSWVGEGYFETLRIQRHGTEPCRRE